MHEIYRGAGLDIEETVLLSNEYGSWTEAVKLERINNGLVLWF